MQTGWADRSIKPSKQNLAVVTNFTLKTWEVYVFQHCISGMNMHERDQCVREAAVWLWSGETILLSERAGGCGLVFGCLSALRAWVPRMRQSFVVLQGICCQLQPSSVLIQFWRPIGSLFVLIARALLAVCCWLLSLISIPWERPFAFSPYDITSWAFRLPLMLAALLPILPGLDIQSGTVAWNRA